LTWNWAALSPAPTLTCSTLPCTQTFRYANVFGSGLDAEVTPELE